MSANGVTSQPTLIDCDPGIDDAIALLLAANSPEIDLLGVTTVCGNIDVSLTTSNALGILALAGRDDVPVAQGSAGPLVRPQTRGGTSVHGVNGVGGAQLPIANRKIENRHAVEFLADTIRTSLLPITLVAIGPLTNVALLYAMYPAEAAKLERLVVMGGSISGGNVTPAAEFNAWFDAEAAYRVLTQPGLPTPVDTVLVGLNVTQQTSIGDEYLRRLADFGQVGATIAAMVSQYREHHHQLHGRPEVVLHDAVAVAEAIRPGIVQTENWHVEVDCGYGPSRGTTVVDQRGLITGAQTIQVGVSVDALAVQNLLADRISLYR